MHRPWQDYQTNTTNCYQGHRQRVELQSDVKLLYGIIGKVTGSIVTASFMQKMIKLLKAHTAFNANSHFIDHWSRLGNLNLHVAQDPGVQFSFGIEIKWIRWMLS